MIRIRWTGVLFLIAGGATVGAGLGSLFGEDATALMGVVLLGAGLADVFLRPSEEAP